MKSINDIFPTELTAVLDSIEFEENGDLLITELKYSNNDLQVFFKVTYGYSELPEQNWRLDISDLEKDKIARGLTTQIEAYSDHFLLYEFTDTYTELYFNGKADNSEQLFIDLYKSYVANYDSKMRFGYGINAPNGLVNLCTYKNGLFARGPIRILEKYATCLKMHSIKTNYINSIKSVTTDLKLLIFGDSYFIGKEFKFTLLNV